MAPDLAVRLRTGVAVALFGVYAAAVALMPVDRRDPPAVQAGVETMPAAIEAWRSAGCHWCHSVYGLGGHTGPDLTNIISRMGPEYVRVVIETGRPGMPAYSDRIPADLDRLIEYLEAIDRSGRYPAEPGAGYLGQREDR
ncbi:MAG: cytochrome c [Phycisphaeraceae bacterium]|nr:cytochrome c [Phycisphaeraceae bacterium]